MSENQLSSAATPLIALAERARSAGHEPWLFYRDGWDWCWRSWSRVADHVARSAAVLRESVAKPPRAGFGDRQHPDSITAELAIQAAGWVALPVAGDRRQVSMPGRGVWVATGAATAGEEPRSRSGERSICPPSGPRPICPPSGPRPICPPSGPRPICPPPGERTDIVRVELPPALAPLDRTERWRLVPDAVSSSAAVAIPGREPSSPERLVSPEMLASSARRFDRRLPATDGRAVVCATPELDPGLTRLLTAWTLIRDAAWVLEPEPEAFIETVLWVRPTVVWARAAELEQLAARYRARKHRRRSRLKSVVAAGGDGLGEAAWDALGIRVVTPGDDPFRPSSV